MHERINTITLRSDSEELRRMVCSGCGENAIDTERRIGLPLGAVGPSTVSVEGGGGGGGVSVSHRA